MGFWVRFDNPGDTETVYLSNGGHSESSHGVAMLYDRSTAEFRFRRKNGQEWRVKADNIMPGIWYHLSAAWGLQVGSSYVIPWDRIMHTVCKMMIKKSGTSLK